MQCSYQITQFSLVSTEFLPYDETQMSTPLTPTTDLRAKGEDTGLKTEPMNAPEEKTGILQVIWETVRYALIAALIIIPIRTFIAQPFVWSRVTRCFPPSTPVNTSS